jgi:Ca2+-binding EF-hand superfamily protein
MTATAQDVINVKLDRAFDALDGNHDGYLDFTDFDQLSKRYLDAYRLSEDDRRTRAMRSFFQMYWLELLRHAGVDTDRLTKEQFVTGNRNASIDTSRLNLAEGAGHVVFDVIDVNGDNEISKDEFARCLRDVWRSDRPDAMDSFDRLDTDGDGAISRHEFIRAVREYLISNDPEAPGSLFFGHV